MTESITVLGRTITATAAYLDEGLDISLFGGDATHVGAVTLADGSTLDTLSRPGHRESVLTEDWAGFFAARCGCPVCVRAGVHFDSATKADIAAILEACQTLRDRLGNTVGQRRRKTGLLGKNL